MGQWGIMVSAVCTGMECILAILCLELLNVPLGLSSIPPLSVAVSPAFVHLVLQFSEDPLDVNSSNLLCVRIDSWEMDQWPLSPAIEHSYEETSDALACSHTHTGVWIPVFTDAFLD